MKKFKYQINSNKDLKYKNTRINDYKSSIKEILLNKYKPSSLVFRINDRKTKKENEKVA
tara:strand:+ start:278 stop:454 length:177 start_codon:yes stop_codon:yes gene_type:complete